VRILTRNPHSDKARALAKLGAQLTTADLTDPSTLPQAFKDVWGVFAVTDFYDTVRPLTHRAKMKFLKNHLVPRLS
jgi:uncharacterized protein YbjT (DUF2867 family)